MTVSIMLRLAKDALLLGRLAGHVEVVETGEHAVVRDADELLEFLRAAERGQHPTAATDQQGTEAATTRR